MQHAAMDLHSACHNSASQMAAAKLSDPKPHSETLANVSRGCSAVACCHPKIPPQASIWAVILCTWRQASSQSLLDSDSQADYVGTEGYASPPEPTLSGPEGAAAVKIIAFRRRAWTVSEGWPPVLSHFLMFGASRLVSLDIGSYHPRYCNQPCCQHSTLCTTAGMQGMKSSSPREPCRPSLVGSLWPQGGRRDAFSCQSAETGAACFTHQSGQHRGASQQSCSILCSHTYRYSALHLQRTPCSGHLRWLRAVSARGLGEIWERNLSLLLRLPPGQASAVVQLEQRASRCGRSLATASAPAD